MISDINSISLFIKEKDNGYDLDISIQGGGEDIDILHILAGALIKVADNLDHSTDEVVELIKGTKLTRMH